VLSHIYYSILSVKVILTDRLFSRLGTLTNAKQNDELEQAETAKNTKTDKTSIQIKLKHAHFAH